MVKVTPNPPATDEPTSRAQSARNKKIDDAATRALDFYLKPKAKNETSDKSDSILRIDPGVDSECLLANLTENLASANAMISDLAFDCAFHAIRPPSPPTSGHLFHGHPARQSERSDAGLHC